MFNSFKDPSNCYGNQPLFDNCNQSTFLPCDGAKQTSASHWEYTSQGYNGMQFFTGDQHPLSHHRLPPGLLHNAPAMPPAPPAPPPAGLDRKGLGSSNDGGAATNMLVHYASSSAHQPVVRPTAVINCQSRRNACCSHPPVGCLPPPPPSQPPPPPPPHPPAWGDNVRYLTDAPVPKDVASVATAASFPQPFLHDNMRLRPPPDNFANSLNKLTRFSRDETAGVDRVVSAGTCSALKKHAEAGPESCALQTPSAVAVGPVVGVAGGHPKRDTGRTSCRVFDNASQRSDLPPVHSTDVQRGGTGAVAAAAAAAAAAAGLLCYPGAGCPKWPPPPPRGHHDSWLGPPSSAAPTSVSSGQGIWNDTIWPERNGNDSRVCDTYAEYVHFRPQQQSQQQHRQHHPQRQHQQQLVHQPQHHQGKVLSESYSGGGKQSIFTKEGAPGRRISSEISSLQSDSSLCNFAAQSKSQEAFTTGIAQPPTRFSPHVTYTQSKISRATNEAMLPSPEVSYPPAYQPGYCSSLSDLGVGFGTGAISGSMTIHRGGANDSSTANPLSMTRKSCMPPHQNPGRVSDIIRYGANGFDPRSGTGYGTDLLSCSRLPESSPYCHAVQMLDVRGFPIDPSANLKHLHQQHNTRLPNLGGHGPLPTLPFHPQHHQLQEQQQLQQRKQLQGQQNEIDLFSRPSEYAVADENRDDARPGSKQVTRSRLRSDGTPILDVRHFLATWDEESEDLAPTPVYSVGDETTTDVISAEGASDHISDSLPEPPTQPTASEPPLSVPLVPPLLVPSSAMLLPSVSPGPPSVPPSSSPSALPTLVPSSSVPLPSITSPMPSPVPPSDVPTSDLVEEPMEQHMPGASMPDISGTARLVDVHAEDVLSEFIDGVESESQTPASVIVPPSAPSSTSLPALSHSPVSLLPRKMSVQLTLNSSPRDQKRLSTPPTAFSGSDATAVETYRQLRTMAGLDSCSSSESESETETETRDKHQEIKFCQDVRSPDMNNTSQNVDNTSHNKNKAWLSVDNNQLEVDNDQHDVDGKKQSEDHHQALTSNQPGVDALQKANDECQGHKGSVVRTSNGCHDGMHEAVNSVSCELQLSVIQSKKAAPVAVASSTLHALVNFSADSMNTDTEETPVVSDVVHCIAQCVSEQRKSPCKLSDILPHVPLPNAISRKSSEMNACITLEKTESSISPRNSWSIDDPASESLILLQESSHSEDISVVEADDKKRDVKKESVPCIKKNSILRSPTQEDALSNVKDISGLHVQKCAESESKDGNDSFQDKHHPTELGFIEGKEFKDTEEKEAADVEAKESEDIEVKKVENSEVSEVKDIEMSKVKDPEVSEVKDTEIIAIKAIGVCDVRSEEVGAEVREGEGVERTAIADIEMEDDVYMRDAGDVSVEEVEGSDVKKDDIEVKMVKDVEVIKVKDIEVKAVGNLGVKDVGGINVKDVGDIDEKVVRGTEVNDVGGMDLKDVGDMEVKKVHDMKVKDVGDVEMTEVNDMELKNTENIEVKTVEDVEMKEVKDMKDVGDVEMTEVKNMELKNIENIEVKTVEDVEMREVKDMKAKKFEDIETKKYGDTEVKRIKDKVDTDIDEISTGDSDMNAKDKDKKNIANVNDIGGKYVDLKCCNELEEDGNIKIKNVDDINICVVNDKVRTVENKKRVEIENLELTGNEDLKIMGIEGVAVENGKLRKEIMEESDIEDAEVKRDDGKVRMKRSGKKNDIVQVNNFQISGLKYVQSKDSESLDLDNVLFEGCGDHKCKIGEGIDEMEVKVKNIEQIDFGEIEDMCFKENEHEVFREDISGAEGEHSSEVMGSNCVAVKGAKNSEVKGDTGIVVKEGKTMGFKENGKESTGIEANEIDVIKEVECFKVVEDGEIVEDEDTIKSETENIADLSDEGFEKGKVEGFGAFSVKKNECVGIFAKGNEKSSELMKRNDMKKGGTELNLQSEQIEREYVKDNLKEVTALLENCMTSENLPQKEHNSEGDNTPQYVVNEVTPPTMPDSLGLACLASILPDDKTVVQCKSQHVHSSEDNIQESVLEGSINHAGMSQSQLQLCNVTSVIAEEQSTPCCDKEKEEDEMWDAQELDNSNVNLQTNGNDRTADPERSVCSPVEILIQSVQNRALVTGSLPDRVLVCPPPSSSEVSCSKVAASCPATASESAPCPAAPRLPSSPGTVLCSEFAQVPSDEKLPAAVEVPWPADEPVPRDYNGNMVHEPAEVVPPPAGKSPSSVAVADPWSTGLLPFLGDGRMSSAVEILPADTVTNWPYPEEEVVCTDGTSGDTVEDSDLNTEASPATSTNPSPEEDDVRGTLKCRLSWKKIFDLPNTEGKKQPNQQRLSRRRCSRRQHTHVPLTIKSVSSLHSTTCVPSSSSPSFAGNDDTDGNELAFGSAKVELQLASHTGQAWQVVDGPAGDESLANTSAPSVPIVLVRRLVLRCPSEAEAKSTNAHVMLSDDEGSAEFGGSATGSLTPMPSSPDEEEGRDDETEVTSADCESRSGAPPRTPRLLIRRTHSGGAQYCSFLRGAEARLQPVVALRRSPVLDQLARRLAVRPHALRIRIATAPLTSVPSTTLPANSFSTPATVTDTAPFSKPTSASAVSPLWTPLTSAHIPTPSSPRISLLPPLLEGHMLTMPVGRKKQRRCSESGLLDMTAARATAEATAHVCVGHKRSQDLVSTSSAKRRCSEADAATMQEQQQQLMAQHANHDDGKDDVPDTCNVCGRKLTSCTERARHVRQHRYHCQRCDLAFRSQDEFVKHLSARHPATRERHHCLLCARSFPSAERHALHVRGRLHRALDALQRRTVHALFSLLTGRSCPGIAPLTDADRAALRWLPAEPGAVHFYHQATPLQMAIQDWTRRQEPDASAAAVVVPMPEAEVL